MNHSTIRQWDHNRHRNYHKARWVSDASLIDKIIKVADGKERGGTVVDLGCGLGQLLAEFAKSGSLCIGVDSDKNMVEKAIRHENIQYVNMAVEDVKDIAADVVVARNVLHYIPGDVIAQVASNIMKPGGVLILAQAVPPSTKLRSWHNELHDIFSVNYAPSTDDMVSFLRLSDFHNISSQFSFHRMNVNEWLHARTDSPEQRLAVLEHHKKLMDYPEFEAAFSEDQIEVTVRFSIVYGTKSF